MRIISDFNYSLRAQIKKRYDMLFITDETPDLIKHSAGAYHPDADGICFFVGREIGLTGDQPRSCVSIEIENIWSSTNKPAGYHKRTSGYGYV